ncbi:hypothetical protein M409DRAFT_57758 [Zasmidium cellare ATCC 36951]|uniref:Uncharacterized protein n=1 Tax=Zasmidium cellare ATCC 36951 TaxID=1080233 RepID=A0A6A6C7L1_ZASCE|nr:uncharacterized protein M409DRAFT_57758 [Zasmidium cellare ATCC 36951]KAF2163084.1 hypothetical protein M409DRAFT_57758 [Zasmidium cellare ATCC 36951]
MVDHMREVHKVDVPSRRRRSMGSNPIKRSTTSTSPLKARDRSIDVGAVILAAPGDEKRSLCGPADSRDSGLEIDGSKKYMSMPSHDSRSRAARHQPILQPRESVLADKHDPYPEKPAHRGRMPTRAFDDRKKELEQVSNALRRESNSQNTHEGVASRTEAKVQAKSTALDRNATRVGDDHPPWAADVKKDFRSLRNLDLSVVSPNALPILPSYSPNCSDAWNHIVRTGTEDPNDAAIESRGQPDVEKLKARSTLRRSPVPSSTIDSNVVLSSGRDKNHFEDNVRDLENRLDRLLTLTEPTPPSSPGDSTGEEITSLSNFGSPDRSPGTRQHANGYQQPGAGPFQFPGAPPETGRPFRKQANQPRDDGDEGEHPSGARDRGNRSSISQSSKAKRFPCVYRVGDPGRFDSHTTRWEYVSQVLRHLESHNFFMCSKCLTMFTNKEQKSIHDKMRACVKICTNSACKRHTMDFETPSATCNCLLTSDDLWAATFRRAFPHLPLPAPWPSKVQSWLVAPVQNLQEEPWIRDPFQFHTFPLPEGISADTAAQNGFDMQAMIDYNVEPELSAPDFHNTFPTTRNPPTPDARDEFDISATSYPNGALARQVERPCENHSAQPASGDDVQKLREQVAILEQRFEKPSRAEQKESAMLRLAWNRLVEIGDQSVQEGGVLRQVASMLTPELIADGKKDSDESNPSQPIEMSNAMDWEAAGLDPHQLPPGGKGKQRAASRAADSAYYSGMRMN